ncbi:MAG TPA: hypothetical protein VMA74_11130 [Dyella sp.]|uniref:hypothetical protein n=1 Tax=Dyella sp. TaxID=1869338 RepID=UPI002BDF363C|nr:hypothetical protein [Dyella sp.]HUB90264.1 hypothetical protein [Dyella sp.]
MSTSIYDFDTGYAPFEAFAPLAPVAPFALFAWFAAPMQWWADAYLNTCSTFSDAMIRAMTYPYAMPAGREEQCADTSAAHAAAA